ncbi:MAG: hypothetical protein ACSHYA_14400 [Opitutaceae bacterium]
MEEEKKVPCTECRTPILSVTAKINDGICMPCKNGTRKKIEERKHTDVFCKIDSGISAPIVIRMKARNFQPVIEKVKHIGDSGHANKVEMEAQRALVAHAIRHGVNFELYNDHWGRTGYSLIDQFEKGNAWIEQEEQKIYFSELKKEKWSERDHPMAKHGGFLYKNAQGDVIFKKHTWLS